MKRRIHSFTYHRGWVFACVERPGSRAEGAAVCLFLLSQAASQLVPARLA